MRGLGQHGNIGMGSAFTREPRAPNLPVAGFAEGAAWRREVVGMGVEGGGEKAPRESEMGMGMEMVVLESQSAVSTHST